MNICKSSLIFSVFFFLRFSFSFPRLLLCCQFLLGLIDKWLRLPEVVFPKSFRRKSDHMFSCASNICLCCHCDGVKTAVAAVDSREELLILCLYVCVWHWTFTALLEFIEELCRVLNVISHVKCLAFIKGWKLSRFDLKSAVIYAREVHPVNHSSASSFFLNLCALDGHLKKYII